MSSKILVIDDAPDLLEMFSIVLNKQGYEVETTDNSENVVEMVETFSPDLLLLDVKLRGADGRDLCKTIQKKSNKEIPVILMSSSAALLKDHKECSVVDIIEKPFDLKAVTEKINIALSNSN